MVVDDDVEAVDLSSLLCCCCCCCALLLDAEHELDAEDEANLPGTQLLPPPLPPPPLPALPTLPLLFLDFHSFMVPRVFVMLFA